MQSYKKIAMACALFLALVGCWYWFAGRNDVHDIGERADTVRNELADAEKSQRDQAATIDRAEEAARDSQQTASRIEEIELSDAEVIRESESILDRVRKRGPAQGTGES